MNKLIDAWDEYKKAKHLLTVTLPVTNDPKLLLGVLENIHNSMQSSIDVQKELGLVLKSDVMKAFQEVKEIVMSHKRSPVEFKRKDKFIICSSDYLMKEVSVPKVKRLLNSNYALLHDVVAVLNRKE